MVAGALDGPVPAAALPGQRVRDLLDEAIDIQRPRVRGNVARARRRSPEAAPAQIIRNLERMYVSSMTGTGAVAGGTAAAKGAGPGVAQTLSAGSSLGQGVLFVLSVADVHGATVEEVARDRTILMGVLLGAGSAKIPRVAERTGRHWARQAVARVPAETLRPVNRVMGDHFVTKYGTKAGVLVLGQVAPIGFGAVIGGGFNAFIAALHVAATRRAFGPPPTSFPYGAGNPPD